MTKQELTSRKLAEEWLIKELGYSRKKAKKQLKELEFFGLVKFSAEGNFMVKGVG